MSAPWTNRKPRSAGAHQRCCMPALVGGDCNTIAGTLKLYKYRDCRSTASFLNMPSNASQSTKRSALELRKSGRTYQEIADQLHFTSRTIKAWVKAAGDAGSGVLTETPRPPPRKVRSDKGVGKKVTPVMIRAISRRINNNRFLTANELREKVPGLNAVSKMTVCRILKGKLGLGSGVAVKKPFLTAAQRERRVRWAQAHKNWSKRRWNQVLWSDESHIELWAGGFSGRVWRRKGESRYLQKLIRPSVKQPKKLMAWGCFGNGELGKLIVLPYNTRMDTALYINVLRKALQPSLCQTGTEIFMQDGAT